MKWNTWRGCGTLVRAVLRSVQANCRFLVSDLADYSAHASDPDKFLPWGDVAALELTVPVNPTAVHFSAAAHAAQVAEQGYADKSRAAEAVGPGGTAKAEGAASAEAQDGAAAFGAVGMESVGAPESPPVDGGDALAGSGGVPGDSVTCPICLEQALTCPQVSPLAAAEWCLRVCSMRGSWGHTMWGVHSSPDVACGMPNL